MKKIYEPVNEEHITIDTSSLSNKDIRSIAENILDNETDRHSSPFNG